MRKVPEQVFAVVRLDSGPGCFAERVTVNEIVTSLDLALDEVARLNSLNGGNGCVYFAQATRFYAVGAAGSTDQSRPAV